MDRRAEYKTLYGAIRSEIRIARPLMLITIEAEELGGIVAILPLISINPIGDRLVEFCAQRNIRQDTTTAKMGQYLFRNYRHRLGLLAKEALPEWIEKRKVDRVPPGRYPVFLPIVDGEQIRLKKIDDAHVSFRGTTT